MPAAETIQILSNLSTIAANAASVHNYLRGQFASLALGPLLSDLQKAEASVTPGVRVFSHDCTSLGLDQSFAPAGLFATVRSLFSGALPMEQYDYTVQQLNRYNPEVPFLLDFQIRERTLETLQHEAFRKALSCSFSSQLHRFDFLSHLSAPLAWELASLQSLIFPRERFTNRLSFGIGHFPESPCPRAGRILTKHLAASVIQELGQGLDLPSPWSSVIYVCPNCIAHNNIPNYITKVVASLMRLELDEVRQLTNNLSSLSTLARVAIPASPGIPLTRVLNELQTPARDYPGEERGCLALLDDLKVDSVSVLIEGPEDLLKVGNFQEELRKQYKLDNQPSIVLKAKPDETGLTLTLLFGFRHDSNLVRRHIKAYFDDFFVPDSPHEYAKGDPAKETINLARAKFYEELYKENLQSPIGQMALSLVGDPIGPFRLSKDLAQALLN